MESFILAIDQGTTSTRSCLVSQKGELFATSRQAFPQIFPKPGWVEHDPEQIWETVLQTLKDLQQKHPNEFDQIKGCGITNQRETIVAWDSETHKPLHNAIVWQCRRTQDFCHQLKKNKKEKLIQNKTGLLIDPYFSASKMNWLIKNVPAVQQARKKGTLRFGTVDTFLSWRLSLGQSYITDVTNASRTMLMNLETLNWDPDLLKLFNIRRNELPEITPTSGQLGKIQGLNLLKEGTPLTGLVGDQQSALFGQLCFSTGDVKCTFGTGSFILINTGSKKIKSKNKLLTTVAWKIGSQNTIYALEGGAFVCGAAIQWLRDGLGLFKTSDEVESLARQVTDSDGVTFVPALVGLGVPHWKSEARGIITGIHRGTSKSHIIRATLEAMALQNAEILEVFEKELGKKIKTLNVDGGAVKNNLLMQMQSDFSGLHVVRPKNQETTVMGAAYLAGLGCGMWKDVHEIKSLWFSDKEFKPQMNSKKRKDKLTNWKKQVLKSF